MSLERDNKNYYYSYEDENIMGDKALIIVDGLKVCRDINLHLNLDGTEICFTLSVQEALGCLLMQDFKWVIVNISLTEVDGKLLKSALDRLKSRPLLLILNQVHDGKKQNNGTSSNKIAILKIQEFLINTKAVFHDVPERTPLNK